MDRFGVAVSLPSSPVLVNFSKISALHQQYTFHLYVFCYSVSLPFISEAIVHLYVVVLKGNLVSEDGARADKPDCFAFTR